MFLILLRFLISSSLFSETFETIQNAPTTNDVTDTFRFQSILIPWYDPFISQCFLFFSLSFLSTRTEKVYPMTIFLSSCE